MKIAQQRIAELRTALTASGIDLYISVALGRSGSLRQRASLALLARARPLLNDVENNRNEEDSNEARSYHSSYNRRAHDLARNRTGSRGRPQRHGAQNECKRGHQNWPQAQARPFQGGVD